MQLLVAAARRPQVMRSVVRKETMAYSIDRMTSEDWPQVRSIYLEGIATGHSTFEVYASDWYTWDSAHLQGARLGARVNDTVVAWAALSAVSSRCVYSGVAELNLYMTSASRGQGIGSMLLLGPHRPVEIVAMMLLGKEQELSNPLYQVRLELGRSQLRFTHEAIVPVQELRASPTLRILGFMIIYNLHNHVSQGVMLRNYPVFSNGLPASS